MVMILLIYVLQIINFLKSHAHPEMLKKVCILDLVGSVTYGKTLLESH